MNHTSVNAANFPVLSRLLRMSTKYEVERPKAEVIKAIEATWPKDLAAHDSLEVARVARAIAAKPKDFPGGVWPAYAADTRGMHPAAVIALLRECGYNSPQILSPIFYALARRFDTLSGGSNLARLPRADIERLLAGIHRLYAELWKLPSALDAVVNPAHDACVAATLRWSHTCAIPFLAANARSPIEAVRSLPARASVNPDGAPCLECNHSVVGQILALQLQMWEGLTGMFEL